MYGEIIRAYTDNERKCSFDAANFSLKLIARMVSSSMQLWPFLCAKSLSKKILYLRPLSKQSNKKSLCDSLASS